MAGTAADRVGGQAIVIGAILFALALVLHPDVSTLALASAASPGRWVLVHWAYLIGDVFLIGGLVMLFRHVAAGGTGSGGWAAVGMAGGMAGFTLDAASTGIHLTSFPPVLPADTPNLQALYDAGYAVNGGIGSAGLVAANLGLLLLGKALKDEGWPAIAGIGAMAIGGLELLLLIVPTFTGSGLVPLGTPTLIVNALMPISYALVGVTFMKKAAG